MKWRLKGPSLAKLAKSMISLDFMLRLQLEQRSSSKSYGYSNLLGKPLSEDNLKDYRQWCKELSS